MLTYVPRASPIHALHPATKLAWVGGYIVLGSLSDTPWCLGALLAIVTAAAGWAGILRPARGTVLSLLAIAAVVFGLQVVFRSDGAVWLALVPSSVPLAGGLSVTSGGVWYGLAMALRVLVVVAPVVVLCTTTPAREIARALVETLRVPADYAFLLTTTLRFIPVMTREVATIAQAQRARGLVLEGWNPARKLRAFVPLTLPIVFIAIAKADRLGLSMQLRGYGVGRPGPRRRRTRPAQRLGAGDRLALALLVAVLGLALLAAALYPSAV